MKKSSISLIAIIFSTAATALCMDASAKASARISYHRSVGSAGSAAVVAIPTTIASLMVTSTATTVTTSTQTTVTGTVTTTSYTLSGASAAARRAAGGDFDAVQ